MPSAVSPRATAVRTPGSSSTTSTRAIAANLPVPRPGRPAQNSLSAHASRCAHGQARRTEAASQRPVGTAGAVGLGLLVIPAARARSPSCRRSRPRSWSARCSPPPTRARSPAPSSWTTRSGCRRCPTRRRPPTARARPASGPAATTAAGSSCRPTSGERTLVSDGTTHWAWNSEDRTVVRGPVETTATPAPADPTTAATTAIDELRATSTVAVDGTAEVAGRAAYELVLTPAPTERTLLREVRVAVDAEKRMPLRLTVLATGSTEPALQVGFTELELRPAGPGAVHLHPAARRHRRPTPRRATPSRPGPRPRPSATAGTPSGSCAGPRTPTPETAAPGPAAPTCPRSARRSAARGAAAG